MGLKNVQHLVEYVIIVQKQIISLFNVKVKINQKSRSKNVNNEQVINELKWKKEKK